MFLTPGEIAEMTKKKQRNAQRAVLNALGIRYKVRPDGSLAVLKAHVEQEFGGELDKAKSKKQVEPDWSGVNA